MGSPATTLRWASEVNPYRPVTLQPGNERVTLVRTLKSLLTVFITGVTIRPRRIKKDLVGCGRRTPAGAVGMPVEASAGEFVIEPRWR